jgi:CDP-glucose 4,6-dehydratase
MGRLDVLSGARVLVTGHTGFKGSWLTLWLRQLGAEVWGLAKDIPSSPSHFEVASLHNLVNSQMADVRDAKTVRSTIESVQPDFVFHLAAQSLVRSSYAYPLETWLTNTVGTLHLLDALRDLRKPCVAIMITSDKCYDNVEWIWGYRETDALGGPDPYSASKGAAELAIRSYVRSFFPKNGHVRLGIGRAGNVIGGGDWAEDRIVPDCVRAWSKGDSVSLRNPVATRPWQHVLEPLSGYLNLALALHEDSRFHGEPFNFGPPANQNHAVKELVSAMSPHWDKVRWKVLSGFEGPHESGLLKLNCDKALHHLGWTALWDFETTVRETVLWYRHFYERGHAPMAAYSLHQIESYVSAARSKGLAWAQ